jgi:hypothetical protein
MTSEVRHVLKTAPIPSPLCPHHGYYRLDKLSKTHKTATALQVNNIEICSMHQLSSRLIFILVGFIWSNVAMAIEESKYKVLSSDGPYEIRHYEPVLIAEVTVSGDMDEASSKGFRLIADYIFGNNEAPNSSFSEKISMTAPVTVEPQSNKISMTAPVTVEPLNEGPNLQQAQQWRVNFFMPSKYTLANIAKPKNEIVKLKELPSRHFLVLSYSGFNTQARVQKKTDEAILWAKEKSLNMMGMPQLSRYDPPWTLPMFRRNEIMIEIKAPQP